MMTERMTPTGSDGSGSVPGDVETDSANEPKGAARCSAQA